METDSVQLRDQVAVLRRRWRVIVTVVLLAVAASLLISFRQSPTYTAQATVILAPNAVTAGNPVVPLTPAQISTESQLVASFPVAQQVVRMLKLDESATDVLKSTTVTPDADGAAFVTISVSRGSAKEAAQVANGFATGYIAVGASETAARLADMASTTKQLNIQISRLSDTIDALTKSEAAQRSQLIAKRTGLLSQRSSLESARSDLLLGMSRTNANGQIVSPAVMSDHPSSPNTVRNAILAAVLGLILGIALAFFRDYFDDVIRDETILRKTVETYPVLGRVPHWRDSRSSLMSPNSLVGEAYRGLGANVRYLVTPSPFGDARPAAGKLLLVCSAGPGEGKTSTAANLATVAAGAGLRVVLVDADLRRPRVAQLFGLGSVPGLSEVVSIDEPVDRFLIDVGIDGLRVLPAGSAVPNPAELLASPRMQAVAADLVAGADLVVVDSAALLGVADPLELVPLSDNVLFVIREKVTHKRALLAALQRVEQLGGVVAGVVFNDVSASNASYGEEYKKYAVAAAPVSAGSKR